MSNRDEFINDMTGRLEEVRHDVDEVQDDIGKSDLTERISFNRMTSELYGRIKDIEMTLEELKSASEESWSKLSKKAEEAWHELESSARETLQEIRR